MYQLNQPWRLILGSSSPRRKRMLEEAGLQFELRPIDFNEEIDPSRGLATEAQRLALLKGLSFGRLKAGEALLTADTLVGIDGQILGKPVDKDHAQLMLGRLAGRTHQVATGFCLQGQLPADNTPFMESGYQLTQVTFRALSLAEIKAYVAMGESADKAGAYGAQKKGAALIESINGSFHNVVGLPLAKVIEKLLIYNIISPVPVQ